MVHRVQWAFRKYARKSPKTHLQVAARCHGGLFLPRAHAKLRPWAPRPSSTRRRVRSIDPSSTGPDSPGREHPALMDAERMSAYMRVIRVGRVACGHPPTVSGRVRLALSTSSSRLGPSVKRWSPARAQQLPNALLDDSRAIRLSSTPPLEGDAPGPQPQPTRDVDADRR